MDRRLISILLRGSNGAPAPPAPSSTPITILGASCLAWWHCDTPALITQVAGAVSSWKDVVAAYDAVQAVGASQPLYSATGWNSAAPGITFNGTASELTVASQPFPSANNASSIFVVADQLALVADATTRCAFSYGGDSSTNQRRLHRRVVTATNVVTSGVNTGNSDSAGDFSGRHYIRSNTGAAVTAASLDGVAGSSASTTPGTGTNRCRIGAICGVAASSFFQGVIREIVITGSLTGQQVTDINTYLAARV